MTSGDPFALLDVLYSHSVPCLIIGGHAVAYHGHMRATEDVDVLFKRSPESETNLLSALQELNALWLGNEIDPSTGIEMSHPVSAAYVRQSHLMMLQTDLGFLDIFDYIPGFPAEPLDALFSSAEQRGEYRYVSLHWLRKMKSASDRRQDRLDLEQLPEGG